MDHVTRFTDAPTLEAIPSAIDIFQTVPPNPPAKLQQKFVGANYRAAYEDARKFTDVVFERWPGGSPTADQRVLDFGSGWGRISRLLLRGLSPQQIWASDIDLEMTALMQQTLPGINAVTNSPFPPSVFGADAFDAVTAFSVFSHLSEDAHRAWAREFGRLIRPGGKAFITVLEEDFITLIAGAQAAVAQGVASGFQESLAHLLADANASLAAVRKGQFVYANGDQADEGPRKADFYSWAVAPRLWVEKTWGAAGFKIEDWIPSGTLFEQALVTLTRKR